MVGKSKKPDLGGVLKLAASARERSAGGNDVGTAPSLAGGAGEDSGAKGDRRVTSSVHFERGHLALLRRVAVERANANGGRPSVSDVIADLVERYRAELEREVR